MLNELNSSIGNNIKNNKIKAIIEQKTLIQIIKASYINAPAHTHMQARAHIKERGSKFLDCKASNIHKQLKKKT